MIIAVGMKTLVMTDCLDKEGGDWKKGGKSEKNNGIRGRPYNRHNLVSAEKTRNNLHTDGLE